MTASSTSSAFLSRRPRTPSSSSTGWLLLPAAAEPHAHLDKAFLAERLTNERGDLLGAIDVMVAARPSIDLADTIARAERAARLMAANGFGFVRTHVDTTLDNGLLSVEALVEVRHRVADLLDVEIVALCGWPVTGPEGDGQRALLRDAIARGADLVGGCPHLEDGAVRAATETLLAIADGPGRRRRPAHGRDPGPVGQRSRRARPTS